MQQPTMGNADFVPVDKVPPVPPPTRTMPTRCSNRSSSKRSRTKETTLEHVLHYPRLIMHNDPFKKRVSILGSFKLLRTTLENLSINLAVSSSTLCCQSPCRRSKKSVILLEVSVLSTMSTTRLCDLILVPPSRL